MTDLRTAAQQALEALETALETMKEDWHVIDNEFGPSEGGLEAAIDGRLNGYGYFQKTISTIAALREALEQPAQSAEQRAWVGLTEDEIKDMWDGYLSNYQISLIKEMMAALKEKNT